MMFTVKEPFYGILLSSMVKKPDRTCPTLGVGTTGKLFELVYNPDFVASVTEAELMELLKHETLHVAFNTFSIFEDYPEDPSLRFLRNIASDMEINCYIDSKAIARLGPALPSIYGWEPQLGSREYYRRLVEKKLQNPDENDDSDNSKESNTPQQGQDEFSSKPDFTYPDTVHSDRVSETWKKELHTLDTHEYWPSEKNMTKDELDMITDMAETLLVYAAEETEKSRGTIPGCLKIRLQEIKDRKKAKPVTDWKQYVRRYVGREFSESTKRSYKRLSKRFEGSPGKRKIRQGHFLVAIDTSGSVSIPEYLEFFRQLRTVYTQASFHVVECDAKIQYEYDYKREPNLTLHGCGGTDFQPVIDKFIAERKKYDALIYFTDGESDIPKNTPAETLWVISSKGDHDTKKYKVNGASAVFIPQQNEKKEKK